MSLNDKLTPEIAALITNIEENGGNNHGADDYSYLMEALAALKSLAQQVQLLKGADEERARLRNGLEALIDSYEVHLGVYQDCKDYESAIDGAKELLAASPTGYTESLEELLKDFLINEECSCLRLHQHPCPRCSVTIKQAREALGVK